MASAQNGGVYHSMFPNHGLQVLSSMIHLLGVSFLSFCLSRRAPRLTFSAIRSMSWARICTVAALIDSWLFLFTSGVLILGVGLDVNPAICSAAVFLCIGCYGTSKLFIYCFLIEKVYVVWAPKVGMGRFRSPVYVICMITVALYFVVAAILLFGRIHYLRQDGACVIGLKKLSSLTLLSYDLYVNIFLTSLFLWPLFKPSLLNPRIRRVALRTFLAAAVALTTSTINIVVVTVLKGEELGWLCLGSCGTDVLVNSFAIFWVTGGTSPLPNRTMTSFGLDSDAKSDVSDIVFQHPKPNQNAPGPSSPKLSYQHQTKKRSASFGGNGTFGLESVPEEPAQALQQNSRSPLFNPTMFNKRIRNEESTNAGIQITVTSSIEHDMDGVPELQLTQSRRGKVDEDVEKHSGLGQAI